MGHLDLTLLGLEVSGMQILKDNHIIHGVFGIFVLLGCNVTCACDYVKDVEVLVRIKTY